MSFDQRMASKQPFELGRKMWNVDHLLLVVSWSKLLPGAGLVHIRDPSITALVCTRVCGLSIQLEGCKPPLRDAFQHFSTKFRQIKPNRCEPRRLETAYSHR